MKQKKNIILKFSVVNGENNKSSYTSFFKINEKRKKEIINFTNKNASMNTIIIGSTGSGKTKSLILPILNNFFKNNFSGLIIDVKNDFTNDIYKLAKITNRIDDIIEIGNYETATKINLLEGLTGEEIKELLRELLTFDSVTEKNGEYWNQMSLRVLNDIIDIIIYINKYEKLPLTFYLIYLILNNSEFSEGLYKKFIDLPNSTEKELLISSVNNYSFHIFNSSNKKENITQQNRNWTYQRYIGILKQFFSGNLLDNLNNLNNQEFALDFKNLLYIKNKIIIIRFDLLNSYIGNKISKFIRKKMINDIIVFNNNIKEENRKETFVVADEFQSIISVDDDTTFNDNEWFDKSRSFKCYQVIATQSLSSLYSKTKNHIKIDTLINNCRNKFFLSNEDINTNKYFNELSMGNFKKELYELKLGECYYYYFDNLKGEKNLKLISLNLRLFNKLNKS